MKQRLSVITNVIKSELRLWLMQPRMLSVGVLIIFIYHLVIVPLTTRADRIGAPLNRLEPFIAVCNSSQAIMLIPFVFLILFSDYPRISANSLMILSRTGKRHWLSGEILFAASAVLLYLCVLLCGTALSCPSGILSKNWSDAATKYEAIFPNEYGSFASFLLPSNLYNQMPLHQAFWLSFVWLFCYLLVLILMQYFFRLINLGSLGLVLEILVIACGVLTCSLRTKWMWVFPMANTIPWLHYTEIIRKPVVPIWQTNLYWGILMLLFGGGCYIRVQKYDFS